MKSEYCVPMEDAVLRSAFLTAAEEEMAAIEAIEVAVRYPTAAQRRKEERIMRRALGGKRRGGQTARVAAMIAAFLSLSVGVLLLQPTVRATVVNAVVHFFEDHMSISFGAEEPEVRYVLGEHEITYIPRGYVLTGTSEDTFCHSQTYTKSEASFDIYYYSSGKGVIAVDTEHTTSKLVQIGDLQGYLVRFEETGICNLYWGSDEFSFIIKGALEEKEILKIARGIVKGE